ncbi:MAG: PhoH family protein, partial [Bacteroidota bacterium]
MGKLKKIFVIDTNVLLHDYQSIYNFQENDVIIPITVLEELDRLKKGNDIINYHAREFTRELDKLSGDKLFNGGISLGKNHGKLSIETRKPFSEKIRESFPEPTPDHRILAIAEHVHHIQKNKQVILITKDINLRMKAKSIGILSQDYETDKVRDLDNTIEKSVQIIENFNERLISKLYDVPEGLPVEKFKLKFDPTPNEYFIFRNNSKSVLSRFSPVNKMIERVEKLRTYSIEPRNAEQAFSLDALMRDDLQLVALTGKAGTGKTLLALAAALHQEKKFNQIYLARPIVPLANRDLGYLPGDVSEKIGPYMQPLFDNLAVIKNKFKSNSKEYKKIEDMLKEEKLLITPLAYIRGRSLSNAYFIVDEAQNLTPHEVKTIITRAGENTKMVFT